jgi:hypothetical protein
VIRRPVREPHRDDEEEQLITLDLFREMIVEADLAGMDGRRVVRMWLSDLRDLLALIERLQAASRPAPLDAPVPGRQAEGNVRSDSVEETTP